MPSGPADGVWSNFASRVSQSPFRVPSSNRDEGCPLNLTPSRRFCDRWMTQGFVRCAAIRATRNPIPLPLPFADAAGLARPGLNPRIERLGIERIAMSPRQLRSSRAACFPGAHMRNADLGIHMRNAGLRNSFGNNDLGLGARFRADLRALVFTLGSCFELNRHELRGRPKRLRRKRRPGKVEAEELVGTILVRDSQTAPRQQRRANDRGENIFQDHSEASLKYSKEGTAAHLGSGQRNS